MSYKDLGYNKLLYKQTDYIAPKEFDDSASSQQFSVLNASVIGGGRTVSKDGKMEIDWDNGRIIISDGANPRIVIGKV